MHRSPYGLIPVLIAGLGMFIYATILDKIKYRKKKKITQKSKAQILLDKIAKNFMLH